ncbi:MAG: hypothetical protein P4L00_04160, partial [Candidatus Acidoferrales bacterium]|nr:hypothetical protein [Candidatus Acidoferrales bacterium]
MTKRAETARFCEGDYPMRFTSRLVGFGLLGLFFAMVGNAPAAKTSDEPAIRAAVMAFQEAWNHHDMKAMG